MKGNTANEHKELYVIVIASLASFMGVCTFNFETYPARLKKCVSLCVTYYDIQTILSGGYCSWVKPNLEISVTNNSPTISSVTRINMDIRDLSAACLQFVAQ